MAETLPDIWSNLNWPIVHSHLNTTPQFCPLISGQLIGVSSNINLIPYLCWLSTVLPEVSIETSDVASGGWSGG